MASTNALRDGLVFLLLVVVPFAWASARLYKYDQHGISNTTFRAAFGQHRRMIIIEALVFALVVLIVLVVLGEPLLTTVINGVIAVGLWIGVNMLVIAKFNNWR